jgi:hypothetical protein
LTVGMNPELRRMRILGMLGYHVRYANAFGDARRRETEVHTFTKDIRYATETQHTRMSIRKI